MPSISVIIPAYNRSSSISRAIQSILEQTVSASEIIVVDDASTDDTVGIVEQHFPQCKVIRFQYNQGAQAARTAGIRAATGDWVAFLDSDDWWLPQKLEWQLEKAAEGFSVIHGPGLLRRNGQDELFAIPPVAGEVYADLLRCPSPMYQGLLAKKECFEKAGFPDPTITSYQEWDTSLLLARHYAFGYVDKPLFVYEVQEDSISKDDYRALRGYEQVVNKWRKEILRVAGAEALFHHYCVLAATGKALTGWPGYLHYLRLGSRLSGCDYTKKAKTDIKYAAKLKLKQAMPWLVTLKNKFKQNKQ